MNNPILNLVGIVLPPVIDLINSRVADTKLRFLISLVICVVISVAINFNQLQYGTMSGFWQSLAIIGSEAQLVYNMFWKNSDTRASMIKKIS